MVVGEAWHGDVAVLCRHCALKNVVFEVKRTRTPYMRACYDAMVTNVECSG